MTMIHEPEVTRMSETLPMLLTITADAVITRPTDEKETN